MEGDAAYFSRRASEERLAASNAASSIARDAHLEMAERYDQLAVAIAAPVAVGSRPRMIGS